LKWFKAQGISQQVVHSWHKKGFLKKLGGGAYMKAGDSLDWRQGVRSLQLELNLPLHIGGKTALELLKSAHYLALGRKLPIYLLSPKKCNLPIWALKNAWGVKFHLKTSNLFGKSKLAIANFVAPNFNLKVSSRERGILEFINSLDLTMSFETLDNYMEGLLTLRSEILQLLLEQCSSIKVKRIFLYNAEKLNLPFFKKLDLENIDLGIGKRVVVKGGKLDKKYLITVPRGNKSS